MSRARRTADGLSAASLPDRSSVSKRAARRAIKRAFGQPVSILDYAPPGTTDWTAAFNEAFLEVGQSSDKRLHVPGGNFAVTGVLTGAYPVFAFGDGMSFTVVNATHLGTIILLTGQFGTGPRLHNMTLGFTTGGATSVAHIQAINYQDPGNPTNQYSPDFLHFWGLNLTGYGGSKAQYNIVVNGASRADDAGGAIPIGVRSITMGNILGFNATVRALDLNHVRSGHYSDINLYGGAGVAGAAVYGLPGKLAYDNKFFGGSINGTFGLSDCDGTKLYGVTTTVSKGANVTNEVNL